MQEKIKVFTVPTAAASFAATSVASLLGPRARILGFVFSCFVAGDSASAILYMEAPATTYTPIWAYSTDYATIATSSMVKWLGVNRTPASIPNWVVIGSGSPSVATDYGGWPMACPTVFEGKLSTGSTFTGGLRLQVTNVGNGTVTALYLDGDIPQDQIL